MATINKQKIVDSVPQKVFWKPKRAIHPFLY